MNMIKSFIYKTSGATSTEYGLIAALIAVALIGALWDYADSLYFLFDDINDEINYSNYGT